MGLPESERDEAQEIQAQKFKEFISPAFNQAIQTRAGVDGKDLSQFDQLQLRWKAVEAQMAALAAADSVPLHNAAEAKSAAASMLMYALASSSTTTREAEASGGADPLAKANLSPEKAQPIAKMPRKPVTLGVEIIQGRMTGTAVLEQMKQAKAQKLEPLFDGTSGTASKSRAFGADIAGTAVRTVQRARAKQETKEQMLKSAVLFIFLTGVQYVTDIEQEHLEQFAHLIQTKWPVHYWKSPKEKDLTSPELMERAEKAGKPIGLVPTTIERHMNTIAVILAHAKRERNGLDFEPEIRRLIPNDPRTDAEKREFPTQQDMKKVFGHPLWSGCAGKTRGGRHKFGNCIIKDHHYWINLTLAYTGARRSEIAGLLESDVRQEDGIPYISIRPNHLRGLKTKDSKRQIPLHPHLVKLGFLEFAAACRRRKHLALFPEAVPEKLRHLAHSPDAAQKIYDEKFGDTLDYMARKCFELVTTHLWIPPCQVAFDRMKTCDRMRTFIRPQRYGDLMTAGRYGDACPETGPNQVQELTAR